jgi:TonB family protein
MQDEKKLPETQILPDKSVWRFAISMGVLVLLLLLLSVFSDDIRHILNPPPTKTTPANLAPTSLEKAINLSDEELKTYLIKFIKAFYVDQKKGYFDPPSYFSTITDTYYNYHHLTHRQLKTINRERRLAYQKQTLNWLEPTLSVDRRNDTLVVTYWTKQTYTRPNELVRVQADILMELKFTKYGKICSLKEIEVLNLISTPIPITTPPTTPSTTTLPTQESTAESTFEPPKPNQEAKINTLGIPDTSPQFKGGQKKLVRFLNKNLPYPTVAEDQGVEGKVFVYFVVETNGELSNFKVLRGIGAGCDEEALRVLRLSPNWQAGTLNGVEIRSSYVLPITFLLGN